MRIRPFTTSHSDFPSQLVHLIEVLYHKVLPFCYLLIQYIFIQFADFQPIFRHMKDKSTNLSNEISSVISTWKHHSVEQIVEGIHLPFPDFCCCADDFAGLRGDFDFDFLRLKFMIFQQLQDGYQVHDFGEAG